MSIRNLVVSMSVHPSVYMFAMALLWLNKFDISNKTVYPLQTKSQTLTINVIK